MQKTVRYTIRIVFGGQDYIFFLCCQVGLLSVHDLDDEQRATFMTRFIPRPPPSGNIQAEKTRAPTSSVSRQQHRTWKLGYCRCSRARQDTYTMRASSIHSIDIDTAWNLHLTSRAHSWNLHLTSRAHTRTQTRGRWPCSVSNYPSRAPGGLHRFRFQFHHGDSLLPHLPNNNVCQINHQFKFSVSLSVT